MSLIKLKQAFFSFSSSALIGASLVLLSACGAKTQIDDNYFPTVEVSYLNSSLKSSSTTVISGESITLTFDLRDTNFSAYVSRVPVVSFQASGGTSTGIIGAVTNNGNGTYSALFTGLAAGTATTIHALVNGIEIENTLPEVRVIAGNYSLADSTLVLLSGSVTSGQTVTATMTVKDSTNSRFSSGGLTVAFSNAGGTSTGTWSATTDHGDGTYSAVFTGALVGSATTVFGFIQTQAIMPTVQLAVVGGPSLASAAISDSSPTAFITYHLTYGAVINPYTRYCILENSTAITSCSWATGILPSTYSVTSANGSKVLSIWLKDAAGNVSSRVDTNDVTLFISTPTVAFSSPVSSNVVNAVSSLTAFPVSGTCSESGRTVSVQVTDGSMTVTPTSQPTCSSLTFSTTLNLSSLSDGAIIFKADHTNIVNTAAVQASVSVTKDTQVPTLASATIGNATPSNSTTFNLTYGATGAGVYSTYCILENSTTVGSCAWVTGTLPASFTVTSTNNVKTLSVWIKDSAGNISTRVDTGAVTLDTVTPTLASAAVTNASPTNSTTFNLTYGATTDSYATYCILENSTAVGSCSWTTGVLSTSFTVSVTNNTKVLSVWIKDSAGNISTRVDTAAVVLDTVTPGLASATVTDSSPTSSTTYHLSYGTLTDSYSSYCILENSTMLASCSWTTGTLPASYGVGAVSNAKVLSFWLKDTAGNISSRVDSNSITLNTGVPGVTISAPTGSSVINAASALTSYPVSGSCSENGRTVTIAVTDGSTTVNPTSQPTCSSLTFSTTVNLTTLSDGTITFKADHDNAASTPATESTVAVMKDVQAPTLASTTIGNASPTSSTTFTLSYGTQGGGSYSSYCILENLTTLGSCSWTNGTLPSSYAVTSTNNAKVLSVWLKDSAGNVSTRVDTGSVTLDTITPSLASAAISNSSPTNSTTYNLTYGAMTDSYGSYCILENSTTVASCSWTAGTLPATYTVTSTNNAKVLFVWTKDSAGNTSARIDTNSVTLDTVTPTLASASISDASPTGSTAYDLTYGAITDSYTSYCILENSTTVASCSWAVGTLPATYAVTSTNNAKVLSVWIKDGAGNVSTRVDTGSVTLDTVTPALASASITNASPASSATYNLSYGSVTDSYTSYCILENSTTVASCSWTSGTLPASFAVGATNDAKVLSIWLKDSAGNVSTRVDTNSVTLDTVVPTLASATITNSSPTSIQTYTLNYGATTDIYSSYCILENSTTVASCSWTAGTLPASYGVSSANNAKVLSIWLKDAAGNVSTRVDTNSVTLLTTIPTVAITAPAAAGYANASSGITAFTISGTCSEEGRTVTVAVTDGSTTVSPTTQPTCTSLAFSATVNLTSFSEGALTAKANHSNAAGTAAPQAITAFTKDTVIPVVTITTPTAGAIANIANYTAFTLSGSCTENGVAVSVSATDGTHTVSSSPTCATGSTPRWTTSLNLNTLSNGAVTLAATQSDSAGNTGSASSVSITKWSALATNSTLTATSSITANGTATSTITLTLKDNNNSAIVGFDTTKLTLSSTGTGNTLVALSGTTNASGQVTTTLKSTVAEVKTLSISGDTSGNSLTGITTTTATFIAGPPVSANSTLAATTGVTANGTSTATVTLTLKDTNNNLVTNFNVAQLTLASTGTGNTVTAFSGTTNASGQATTTLASTKAEIKTLSISADSSGNTLTGISTTTSTFVPGAFASIIFDTQPSATATAGTALAQQPVVKLADANSNPIGSGTGTITLTAYSDTACTTPTTGLLATTNPVSASSGTATFAGLKLNKISAIRIGASDGTHTVCSSAIAVSAASPTVAAISGPTALSMGSCSSAYTLSTSDAYGNVSNVTSASVFTLGSTGSGVFYSNNTCSTSVTSVSLGNGSSSKVYYFKDPVAETVTQTAARAGYNSPTIGVTSIDTTTIHVVGQPDFTTNNNARYGLGGVASQLMVNSGRLYVWNRSSVASVGSRILTYNSNVTANQPLPLASLTTSSLDTFLVATSGFNGSSVAQMATDGTHFLVADPTNRKVEIFNSVPTSYVSSPDLFLGTGAGAVTGASMASPFGVATDGTHVAVVDDANNRVLIWNTFPTVSSTAASVVLGQPDMVTALSNGINGTPDANTLSRPKNVIIVGTRLLVSDYGNNRVLIWNTIPTVNQTPADVVIGQPDFVTTSSAVTAQKLNLPYGMYHDGASLYIVDGGNNRVLVYGSIPTSNNATASYVIGQANFTARGSSTANFSVPLSITGTGPGNIFVSDTNSRVLNWTSPIISNGQAPDKVIGQQTFTGNVDYTAGAVSSTNLTNPLGVCSDGTALYASDSSNNRILVWSTVPTSNNAAPTYVLGQPDFVSSTANNPSVSLGLSLPSGIKCNANYLAMADSGNNRVLIWNLPITGNQQAPNHVLGQSDFTGNASGLTQTTMRGPSDVTIDSGHIGVTDTSNRRVLIWNAMPPSNGASASTVLGQPDFVTGTSGTGSQNLGSEALSLYYDGTHLIVGDGTVNNRLLIWNGWPTSNQQIPDNIVTGYTGFPWSDGTRLYLMNSNATTVAATSRNRILVWNSFPTTNVGPDRAIGQANTCLLYTSPSPRD